MDLVEFKGFKQMVVRGCRSDPKKYDFKKDYAKLKDDNFSPFMTGVMNLE